MVKQMGSQRGLSRVESIVGIITVVVVVSSLFMLKGKFVVDAADVDADVELAASSTPDATVSPTAAVADLPSDSPSEGRIFFSVGSTKLPIGAEATLAPLVTALRNDPMQVALLDAEPASMAADVARARIEAVRHALEADGISAGRLLGDAAAGVGSSTPRPSWPASARERVDATRQPPTLISSAASGAVRIELRSR